MKGIWNKVLRIDLTEGKAEDVSIADEVYDKYGLGSGIASYLLYREMPEKIDRLGSENTVVIAPGLFVGTGVPTGSKTAITFSLLSRAGLAGRLWGLSLGYRSGGRVMMGLRGSTRSG
jgi:aldehyde:ferredoxin oxidoreductase